MGQVQTKELANGNLQLEITYGGAGAPFGGVDSSAPPAYIDPRCFTSADGAIVVTNKICALALENFTVPTLWSGTAGVTLIGCGTFYNSLYGELNYALGYIRTPFAGPPSGSSYTFYITSWSVLNSGTVYNDVLTLDLYDSVNQATAASITLPCIPSSSSNPSAGTGATGSVSSVGLSGTVTAATLTGGTGYAVNEYVQLVPTGYTPSDYAWVIVTATGTGGSISTVSLAPNTGLGYSVGSVTAGATEANSTIELSINGVHYTENAYTGGSTAASIVAAMASAISGNTLVSASPSVDGNSIIITALTPGSAGNSITVLDSSTANVSTNPPPFYFPARTAVTLQGGADATASNSPSSFHNVSTASVGGTIYFANLGPIILKYSGPGSFAISSMYQGVSVLSKFAGSLIGAGVIPQLGFEVQNQDMIFAWTAAGELDIWKPLNGSGNVTGAGFEQLADIGEFLSGIIISNGTAYILRKEGVSYATPTGNGLAPFNVNHIGLGPQGEGTQVPNLVTQYDSVGCYIGNSDVWQLTGGISAIGTKIRQTIFAALAAQTNPDAQLTATSGAVFIGGDEYPIAMFAIGTTLYIFNTSNGTWTTLSLNIPGSNITRMIGTTLSTVFTSPNTGQYSQALVGLAIQQTVGGVVQAPQFFTIQEKLPDSNGGSNTFEISFPQEEILFGRDVTIDALYTALQAQLQNNVTLNAYVNGILYASYALQATSFTNVNANPIELQIFPASGTGINTGHSPQLRLELINAAGVQTSLVRFTKVAMFGSIDASQRPV
jgi:hypothetical protein